MKLLPDFKDCPMAVCENWLSVAFEQFTDKLSYKLCVKIFNKDRLNGRCDYPRRAHSKEDVRPEWRMLSKPPLTKRIGDLQWRVLHVKVVVYSFISLLDSNASYICPFCSQREPVPLISRV